MTPEQEQQIRVDVLDEECQQLKKELQRQRLDAYQLQQRLEKLEKHAKSESEESNNPWGNSGLL